MLNRWEQVNSHYERNDANRARKDYPIDERRYIIVLKTSINFAHVSDGKRTEKIEKRALGLVLFRYLLDVVFEKNDGICGPTKLCYKYVPSDGKSCMDINIREVQYSHK
jgi:hypothetical protein